MGSGNTLNPLYESDKLVVLKWFEQYCLGHKNARTRENIIPHIQFRHPFGSDEWKDRYFRRICSDLKHAGHIAATSSRGMWMIPIVTNDSDEIKAALESVHEMEQKALDMLRDTTKLKQRFACELDKITHGQKEMFA